MLLDYAQISHHEQSLHNQDYDDIYFNPQQGFAESDYVFIQGNRLPERFAALAAGQTFVIGETGFGSGMNFILAAQHFYQHAAPNCRLSYISCEKYPIALQQLKIIQQNWPLPELRESLYQHYPHNRYGFHFLPLAPRIDLLLLWGDANELLPELQAKVDAWFLDGFAPSKNAALWSQTVFHAIAANSRQNATVSTFSAAGAVRQGLTEAGFEVRKQTGFGRKREMLCATWTQAAQNPAPFWTNLPPAITADKAIHIVGAGLAGMASAWALANKGLKVKVYHSPQQAAASQVPLAVPYLQLGLEDSPMRRFQLAAWRYNQPFFAQLSRRSSQPIGFYPQTIRLAAEDEKSRARHHRIAALNVLSPDEYQLDEKDHLLLMGSGVFDTPTLLNALRQHEHIDYIERHISASELATWQDDTVIFATAWSKELIPSDWHKHLRPVRGQACMLTVAPKFQDHAYCGRYSIFVFPNKDKIYLGSAYRPNCNDGSIQAADNPALIQFFKTQYPQYQSHYDSAFAGVRASTRDYLPLIGPLPDAQQLRQDYQKWHFDRNLPLAAAANYPLSWHLHTGLGSKGCLTAFFGAEILAAILLDSPLPIPRSLLPYLLPARSIIRDIIYHR